MADRLKDRDLALFRFTLRAFGGGPDSFVVRTVDRVVFAEHGEYLPVRALAENDAYARSRWEPYPSRRWPLRMKVVRVERTFSEHEPYQEVRYPVPPRHPVSIAQNDEISATPMLEVWPN